MSKLIESIGRWGISHNMEGIIIAVIVTAIVCFVSYDCKRSKVN